MADPTPLEQLLAGQGDLKPSDKLSGIFSILKLLQEEKVANAPQQGEDTPGIGLNNLSGLLTLLGGKNARLRMRGGSSSSQSGGDEALQYAQSQWGQSHPEWVQSEAAALREGLAGFRSGQQVAPEWASSPFGQAMIQRVQSGDRTPQPLGGSGSGGLPRGAIPLSALLPLITALQGQKAPKAAKPGMNLTSDLGKASELLNTLLGKSATQPSATTSGPPAPSHSVADNFGITAPVAPTAGTAPAYSPARAFISGMGGLGGPPQLNEGDVSGNFTGAGTLDALDKLPNWQSLLGQSSGGVSSGTLLHVGERPKGDPKYASDEYVYAPPGNQVIVAPREKNKPATADNGMAAIMQILQAHMRGNSGAIQGAANGYTDSTVDSLADYYIDPNGDVDPNAQNAANLAGNAASSAAIHANEQRGWTDYANNIALQNAVSNSRSTPMPAGSSSGGGLSSSSGTSGQITPLDEAQLQLARQKLSQEMQLAGQSNATTSQGQQLQFQAAMMKNANDLMLGQAAQKLQAQNMLAARATRQLVAPGGNTIPSMIPFLGPKI